MMTYIFLLNVSFITIIAILSRGPVLHVSVILYVYTVQTLLLQLCFLEGKEKAG